MGWIKINRIAAIPSSVAALQKEICFFSLEGQNMRRGKRISLLVTGAESAKHKARADVSVLPRADVSC